MQGSEVKSERLRALLSAVKPSYTSEFEISDSFSMLSPFDQTPRLTQTGEPLEQQLLARLEGAAESFSAFADAFRKRVRTLVQRLAVLEQKQQSPAQSFVPLQEDIDKNQAKLEEVACMLDSLKSVEPLSTLATTQAQFKQKLDTTVQQLEEVRAGLASSDAASSIPATVTTLKTSLATKFRSFETEVKTLAQRQAKAHETELASAQCRISDKLSKIECRLWELNEPKTALQPLQLLVNKVQTAQKRVNDRCEELITAAKTQDKLIVSLHELEQAVGTEEVWKPESSLLLDEPPSLLNSSLQDPIQTVGRRTYISDL